jgi:hypothetical protein
MVYLFAVGYYRTITQFVARHHKTSSICEEKKFKNRMDKLLPELMSTENGKCPLGRRILQL